MSNYYRPPRTLRSRWAFFREWLRNPRATSSLSPSGPELAHRMIGQLPDNARRVVELGAGTGVFTHALLEHGIAPEDLLVLEINPALAKLLEVNFPEARIIHGDARHVHGLAEASGWLEGGPADAVFSGLGMLAINPVAQGEILESAFSVLRDGGCFIQFTYGHTNPVSPLVLAELGLHVRRGDMAWRNFPPATVFVFEKGRSTNFRPRQAGH